MSKFALPDEPLKLKALYHYSLKLYKYSFVSSIMYSLPACVLLFLPATLQNVFKISTDLYRIPCWCLASLLLLGLIYKLYCDAYQIPCSFKQAIGQALNRSIPIACLAILYAVVVLSATMLLIVPGIILAFSLMFSFALALTQNQSVLQTLINSHRLVWGHWWYSAIVISFPILVNLSLYFCLFIAFTLLPYHTISWQLSTLIGFSWGLTLLLQTLIIPLTFSVACVLGHDLAQRTASPGWIMFR